MEKDIIDGNKLIAVFMGYKYFPHNMEGVKDPGWKTTMDTSMFTKFNQQHNIVNNNNNFIKKVYLCRSHNDLKYHESWNWLIPALKKFDTILEGRKFLRTKTKWYGEYERHCDMIDSLMTNYDIFPLWEYFVFAIKWYNKKFK